MVDKWTKTQSTASSNGESGILRKTSQHYTTSSENKELLVFGYACKIFRDDEKALSIDQGKHLIPWMGEQSLKIDRYDVRATLNDLGSHEPPPGGYNNRMDYLTSAEQKAEQLCEEERYYSLYHNEMEEEIYQEEELKRLHQIRSSSFGQVGFNYDGPIVGPKLEDSNDVSIDSEESDEVYTPIENFTVPIDILLPNTMKEHAIIEKTAKFISTQGAQMEILIKTKQANNTQFDFLNQSNRLFPYYRHVLTSIKNNEYPTGSTATNKKPTNSDNDIDFYNSHNTYTSTLLRSRPAVSAIAYKPSADCAYTQLISKIKGVPLPMDIPPAAPSTPATVVKPKIPLVKPPAAVKPIAVPAVAVAATPTATVEVKKLSGSLMLAQYYNSDSETENDEDSDEAEENDLATAPPEALQNIIDKTAIYVIKNGKSFEDILRTKDPERFSFLDAACEYHRYYLWKVTGKVPKPIAASPAAKRAESPKSKVITPVSFSIKSKDEPAFPSKPCLPQEPSSGEEDVAATKTTIEQPKTKSPSPLVESSTPKISDKIDLVSEMVSGEFSSTRPIGWSAASSSTQSTTSSLSAQSHTASVSTSDYSISEAADRREREARKAAEDKLKDRLASAAREKLGLLTKEKQLQLERKKKAMAFLNQIKGQTASESNTQTSSAAHLTATSSANNNAMHLDYDSDVESIHSIPSASPDSVDGHESPPEIIVQHTKARSPSHSRSQSKTPARSRSRSHSKSKHKKKKSKSHTKKKSKRKSRSRSRSPREKKYKKVSTSSGSYRSGSSRYKDR